MQANWSLILNVLLLIGVVIAIRRLMKARRLSLAPVPAPNHQPTLGQHESKQCDDIIAVRKVDTALVSQVDDIDNTEIKNISPKATVIEKTNEEKKIPLTSPSTGKTVMMFLLAKENRQLAGYELLQTVLAAGLRFGEGQLFHRHQQPNGQGTVLCSLAAATASGAFDLQNIGAFTVRGLCLFMQASGNPMIDQERFTIMYETAKQLSDGLDTYLLDEKRQPLTDSGIMRYRKQLMIEEVEELA